MPTEEIETTNEENGSPVVVSTEDAARDDLPADVMDAVEKAEQAAGSMGTELQAGEPSASAEDVELDGAPDVLAPDPEVESALEAALAETERLQAEVNDAMAGSLSEHPVVNADNAPLEPTDVAADEGAEPVVSADLVTKEGDAAIDKAEGQTEVEAQAEVAASGDQTNSVSEAGEAKPDVARVVDTAAGVLDTPAAEVESAVPGAAENDDHADFADAGDILADARKAANAEAQALSSEGSGTVADLDAALAAHAAHELAVEEAGGEADVTATGAASAPGLARSPEQAPATSTAAVKTTSKPTPEPRAGTGSASVGAGVSATEKPRADSGTPGKEKHKPALGQTVEAAVKKAGSVITGVLNKALMPVATKYAAVPGSMRKGIAVIAIGTAAQAGMIWGYLLFVRSASEADVLAAAHDGPVKPVHLPADAAHVGHGHEAHASDAATPGPTAAHGHAEAGHANESASTEHHDATKASGDGHKPGH